MKNQFLKKQFAFILIYLGMFSAVGFAQTELAKVKATDPLNIPSKSTTESQTQKQSETNLAASAVGCNCARPGYGCFSNMYCSLYCAYFCRHRVAPGTTDHNKTALAFYIEEKGRVTLKVYDITGRLVATLADQIMDQGEMELAWNSKDNLADLENGVYALQLESKGPVQVQKLIVTK